MCCDNRTDNPKKAGVCPDCDGDVDADGDSLDICNYSPVVCETCGNAPCDGSC
jgi:hypothetical protein